MQELAKSLNSFSLAMALFGAQQLSRLAGRLVPGAVPEAGAGLEPVTQAGVQQLTATLRRTFEAGDQLQRGATDLMFGLLNPRQLQPDRLATLSAELLRQSTAALRSLLPGGDALAPAAGGSGCGGARPCGWGPMPPAR